MNLFNCKRGKAKVKINRNVLPFPYSYYGTVFGSGYTHESNGVTFTVQSDGSVVLNGTNNGSGYSIFSIYNTNDLSDWNGYFLSGVPEGRNDLLLIIETSDGSEAQAIDSGSGSAISKSVDVTLNHTLYIRGGLNATFDNVVVKPMISREYIPFEYSKYYTDVINVVNNNLCNMGTYTSHLTVGENIYTQSIRLMPDTDYYFGIFGYGIDKRAGTIELMLCNHNEVVVRDVITDNTIGDGIVRHITADEATKINKFIIYYNNALGDINIYCMICPAEADHNYKSQKSSIYMTKYDTDEYYIDIFDGFNSIYLGSGCSFEVTYDSTESNELIQDVSNEQGKSYTIRKAGWYRLYETVIPEPYPLFMPCKMYIYRGWWYKTPENIIMTYTGKYNSYDIMVDMVGVESSLTNCIKKARVVYYKNKGFIDIYFDNDGPENIYYSVENLYKNHYLNLAVWKCCNVVGNVDDSGQILSEKLISPNISNEPYLIASVSGSYTSAEVEITSMYDYYMLIVESTSNITTSSIFPLDIIKKGINIYSSDGKSISMISFIGNSKYSLVNNAIAKSSILYGIRGK